MLFRSPQDAGQTQAAPADQGKAGRPDLNLTDDQKSQMKKIHEDAKSQIAAVNNDTSLSADQKQAKVRAIRMSTHKQTEALLTPEESVLVLIDHQPFQFANLHSHEPTMIVNNVVGLAKAAKGFNVPTILTTVTAERGGEIGRAHV